MSAPVEVTLGLDLGTTKTACVAWDPARGQVLAVESALNDPPMPAAPGRSEWDAERLLGQAVRCLRAVVARLDARADRTRVVGIGISSQQHGVVLVDGGRRPLLAARVPAGADGLRWSSHPDGRAAFDGLTATTFTPAHLTRAVLEGLADLLCTDHQTLSAIAGLAPRRVFAAGNGLRRNPLLLALLSQRLGAPVALGSHPEEAAVGAAGLVPTAASAW